MALGKTVGELESTLSSNDLSEWMAYFRVEPFGEDRKDLRMGILASVIANSNRGKSQRPFKPSDFMPYAQDDDEASKIKRLMERLGA